MPRVSMLLVLAVLAADPPGCSSELFRIERSKNANVVLYEAQTTSAGELSADEPFTASWLLLADRGQREALSFFERRMAYGFEVKPVKDGLEVSLKALAQRRISVRRQGACHAALATIGGSEAVLRRIYVKTDEGPLVPDVLSVELFGVDAATGEARYEKIVPSR
jgi:hypothetical protein